MNGLDTVAIMILSMLTPVARFLPCFAPRVRSGVDQSPRKAFITLTLRVMFELIRLFLGIVFLTGAIGKFITRKFKAHAHHVTRGRLFRTSILQAAGLVTLTAVVFLVHNAVSRGGPLRNNKAVAFVRHGHFGGFLPHITFDEAEKLHATGVLFVDATI